MRLRPGALKPNARVCVASDADRFVRLFVDRITGDKP